MREPARKNMYKGVSAAYSVIISELLATGLLWILGFWIRSSALNIIFSSVPEWTIVMANLFFVIQLSGCYQIYCRPTYGYFEEKMLSSKATDRFPLRKYLVRLIFTSIYMALISLITAAVPFFGDFVSICGAVGFTALDFVFLSVEYLKVGRMPKDAKCRLSMQLLNFAIATWFSVVAVLGCIGAVQYIIEDIKPTSSFMICKHLHCYNL
ncbi:GABA transporter 1-like isoform X1 [Castanea sativa]|uniref:GABA transporter 1-like isoform X1 n=1 Tax=Castanea sativa TaxID=21020 RepID=UPI003F64A507